MRKSWLQKILIIGLFIIGMIFVNKTIFFDYSLPLKEKKAEKNDASTKNELQTSVNRKVNTESQELQVHFINVGQGDATLVSCDGEYMLIDAGDNNQGTKIQAYLQKQGIKKLKYVVGTHPDADHIGGLDVVIYKFDCETILLPDKSNDTATYRDVQSAIKSKAYSYIIPKQGDKFALGDTEIRCLSINRNDYDDINDYSIVLKVTFGNCSFLFSGDATEEAEEDIISSGEDISANVYKVGHHGSSSSSSQGFLNKIYPEYAVISCGAENMYGHPHAEILNKLRMMGIKTFRTDEQGTIIATTDGENIRWNCSPSETWQAGEPLKSDNENSEQVKQEASTQLQSIGVYEGATYIVNTNTKKFHYPSCLSVSKMSDDNKLETTNSRYVLISEGYIPCGSCHP